MDLEDLKRVVAEDAARGNEVLGVFGLKFPVGGAKVWSILVLLCIQLYFVVYLRQLSRRKLEQSDPGWDVPWIGMDQWWVARSLLFITITLLPFISLGSWGVITSLRQGHLWIVMRNIGFPSLIFGVLPSLILGVLSWHYRPGSIAPDLSIFACVSRTRRRRGLEGL